MHRLGLATAPRLGLLGARATRLGTTRWARSLACGARSSPCWVGSARLPGLVALLTALATAAGCSGADPAGTAAASAPGAASSASAPSGPAPSGPAPSAPLAASEPGGTGGADRAAEPGEAMSTVLVDHGELDTVAPDGSASLAATTIASTVYKLPDTASRRLGYVRLGGTVARDPEPVDGKGCKGQWYHVYPLGHMCTDEATTDMNAPLVRATQRRPALDRPLPYAYGFVRATAPQYLIAPSYEQQKAAELELDEHLAWFEQNWRQVQRVELGANDVPLDARGIPRPGLELPAGRLLSSQQSLNELFGGDPADRVPWWLDGGRKIPNVSAFVVPESAIFADRVRRKTGLSFVDAFTVRDGEHARRFAVTVDMRLIPATKVKPDTGSPFHGVEVGPELPVPFAWVLTRGAKLYQLVKDRDEARELGDVPRRAILPLSGNARIEAGRRFYQTLRDETVWLQASDLGIVAPPLSWPEEAVTGEKWIDISLVQQTLVLYEGKRPFYATLISSGQDRLGDPETSKSTPRGSFRLQSKHLAAAMDSEENSTLQGGSKGGQGRRLDDEALATVARLTQAEKDGKQLDEEDQRRLLNVKKGRHPEYGVTMRRGSQNYELRDVPWIQYFAAGYALHGAYWHDVFGIPRSHGCVNLSPIDARVVFLWTDPPLPAGWHGINVGTEMGEGTRVVIRE